MSSLDSAQAGPSPRARGSRPLHLITDPSLGSIPACAGEPACATTAARPPGVHPRVRGGARNLVLRDLETSGPSPRARGSPDLEFEPSGAWRSIPACAGEPRPARHSGDTARVHPRVRGGAAHRLVTLDDLSGPSPRARGSRSAAPHQQRGSGSIPACAGEPASGEAGGIRSRVHPRVRGGASSTSHTRKPPAGPSPRARGSLTSTE